VKANFVASEIRDPGRSLPQAIKTAMTVVLLSYELVNAAYYILLPWDTMSTSNAVAVAAASSLLGRAAGVSVTILVALSCAGSIASNIFSVGRLTVAASQRHYLPALFSRRGLARLGQKSSLGVPATPIESAPPERSDSSSYTTYDAPM
jgi:amino acid transporter